MSSILESALVLVVVKPMDIANMAIVFLVLMWLGLVLAWGVITVVQNLTGKTAYDEPAFREPGPIFHDHSAEQLGARSQFAWQSRSHSKAPD
jgi:hypothetical protein